MINIIKALNYKMIRSIDTYTSVGVGSLIALIPILMMEGESLGEMNGGLYSQSYLQFMMLLPYLMACILGATAVGMDMGDKTINYEILSGHSRAEVFMARVIVAIAWSVGVTVVVSALPIAIFTIANGWGPNVVFVDVLMQYIINIVAGVRMTGFVILMTTIVRHYIAGLFISYGIINTSLNQALDSMSGTSSIILGLVLGGMMAIDMGGPFNKAAYVFGTASITSGHYDIMAAVMIGGMIPPCGIALSTLIFKNKYTVEERKTGPTNFVMGLSFITEGAIPFAAADPLRVIPACIIGSGLGGALSMAFGCTLMAPHGGIFVFPVVGNP